MMTLADVCSSKLYLQVIELKPAAALDIFESVLLQDSDFTKGESRCKRLTADVSALDASLGVRATVSSCLIVFR